MLLDGGPLHLHDNGFARVESRRVGLSDRRRGDRLPIELGEHLVDGRAQLALEHRADPVRRRGRHTVLQLGQLVADLRGMRSTRVAAIWPSLT